jgi:class 3 adenylate cyclase/tetratricopeptide (TPR) repeat protein
VRCSACGTENRSGRKFCSNCGSPLALGCPSCGASNEPGDRFCGECGAEISPGPGPAATALPRAQPTAERRLVSVLFADLVGFTTLSEDRDPEEVRELLSAYFDTASDIVARYGGVVEKFIGDAVMAVWGAPVAHEDDAERAVRAALDLVEAVAGLGAQENGPDLRLRAGVLTGEAAVTVGAEGQGMVAGDLVNTASRLQSAATPGTVLVGEATYRAAGRAISFEEAGDRVVKGKALPLRAWRAVRVVAARQGFRRSEGLEPPFVGREEELRLLKDALHTTGRERRARLVSVTGIGGIGKTRLGWEFFKYIDGLEEDIWWHQGRSPAYGEGVTFWALGEMVRMRARIAETEDQEQSRAKLAAILEEHVPDPEERRWVQPAVGHLLGLDEPKGLEREELFAAWRTFFERIAVRGPTVLLFEDLQWADAGQIDFIESVLEWSRQSPILIVTLARPELLDRRPTWGAGQRNFQSVHLEPLGRDPMRELLTGVVPGLPDTIVDQILERAEGVPLYGVETLRMLIDRGDLAPEDGAFRMTAEIDTLDVPDTLRALVASRLDALTPEDRSLVQTASVLGKTFTPDALAGVVEQPRDDIERRLRDLVRKEILILDADPRSPERGQYGFVQSLLKEVAYQTLSRRDRKDRHLAVARYWEAQGDDELAGITASHYVDAYRATPDGAEADALARSARDALTAAAERASSLGSYDQARRYFEQASEVSAEPADRAFLLERAASSAVNIGLLEDAETLIRDALAGHEQIADPVGVARATAKLGHVLLNRSRVTEAIEAMESAVRGLAGLEQEPFVAELYAEMGRAYMFALDADRSIEWCDRALAVAERAGLVPVITEALITKGTALSIGRRTLESLALLRGVLTMAEEQGLVNSQMRARMNLSMQLMWVSPQQGFSVARRGLEVARKFGLREMEPWIAANAAYLAISLGEWDWIDRTLPEILDLRIAEPVRAQIAPLEVVLRTFREGADTLDETFTRWRGAAVAGSTSPQDEAQIDLMEALARFALLDLEKAYKLARAAIALDDSQSEAAALAARTAVWAGDAEGTQEVLRSFGGVRGAWADLTRATIEAGLALLEGRDDEGSRGFGQAIQGWKDSGVRFHQALCQLDLALLAPDEADAGSALEEAREILAGLGAHAFLRRVEERIVALRAAKTSTNPAR